MKIDNKKIKIAVLISLVLLAVFLVLFHFTDTPVPWLDEGVFTNVARNIAEHGTIGMQIAPGEFYSMRNFTLTASYPMLLPVAASLKIFGMGIWQSRLPMIIYMFGFLIVSFLFTYRQYGFWPAVLSALLILSFSPFYGNGRPVQGEVPGLFWMVLGAYFALLWQEKSWKSNLLAALCGVSLGLSASTKPIYMVGLVFSLTVAFLVFRKNFDTKKQIGVFCAAFVAPIIPWFLIHTPTWKAFFNFIPSFLFFAGNHDNGPAISLYQTMIKNSLRFFTESTPILFAFLMTVILVAAFLMYKKKNLNEKTAAETILFSFAFLNWIGYIPGTGWYRYFFPANILTYIFFPAAVFYISKFFTRPILRNLTLLILPVIIFAQFIHLVFLSDTNFMVLRTRSAGFSSVLPDIPKSRSVVFYQAPEAIVFLKSQNYYQFTGMGSIYHVGSTNLFASTSADYILAKGDYPERLCYTKKKIEKYSFFEKISDCKK
jgi:4-amino-4-deoxy-L-arabinose transferase-like glycosyltransferase